MIRHKVLVTGAQGQLGQALLALAPAEFEMVGCSRAELDITNPEQVQNCIAAHKPDVVINAAAYTAVDKAESEPEQARAINTEGARNVAAASVRCGAWPIQISTDFVFDGSQSTPYAPDAPTNPLSVYGLTKRDGEIAAREASDGKATILRTAWVYGPVGHNFLLTMRRLLRAREQLTVVSDQIGTPTSTHSISRALFAMIPHQIGHGETLHWTDAGVASWYDFACRIRECAVHAEAGEQLASVVPIPSSGYPTPAKRPAFSVMSLNADLLRLVGATHWAQEVSRIVAGFPLRSQRA